jgi:phosphate starvation-inducible membrane PsiE
MKIFIYFLSDLLVFVTETRCVHCEVFVTWSGDFLYFLFTEVCALCYLSLSHSRLHFMIVFRSVAAKTLLLRCKQVEFSRKQNVLIFSQSMLLL